MKKIVHLISSPRGDASYSIKLGTAIVNKLTEANPGSTVTTRDLTELPVKHLGQAQLNAFFTRPESRTEEHLENIAFSETVIQELFDTDAFVIGVPVYNFNVPSTLKSWIDHIVRPGITFKVTESGTEGLAKGKKVYLAIVSKAVFSEGPMKAFDFVEPYLRMILGFIGITDIVVIRIEGSSMPEEQEEKLNQVMSTFHIGQAAPAV